MILHFYGILVVVKSIGPSKAYNSHVSFLQNYAFHGDPLARRHGGEGGDHWVVDHLTASKCCIFVHKQTSYLSLMLLL